MLAGGTGRMPPSRTVPLSGSAYTTLPSGCVIFTRTLIRAWAAAESRSPPLLRTVVSVTMPHWSETPIASSFALGVLMCVLRMFTQSVSVGTAGAGVFGSVSAD